MFYIVCIDHESGFENINIYIYKYKKINLKWQYLSGSCLSVHKTKIVNDRTSEAGSVHGSYGT